MHTQIQRTKKKKKKKKKNIRPLITQYIITPHDPQQENKNMFKITWQLITNKHTHLTYPNNPKLIPEDGYAPFHIP